jgi:hypothetical protein
MNLSRLGRGELIAVVGGLLLAIGVFAPWYETSPDNRNAIINGARGTFSCFDAHPILRWLLLAAAVAPLILAWIVVREHELSWPRGEMTAVAGIAAAGLTLYVGILDRPGEPAAEIHLRFGWFIAALGTFLIIAGGALRASGSERPRKPPGVL